MTALVLRLAGPFQSWAGYRVSSKSIPTNPVPTMSAVAGLLGCCLGERDYLALVPHFGLRVRLDRYNAPETDLQVAAGPKNGTPDYDAMMRAFQVAHGKTPGGSGAQIRYDGKNNGLFHRGFIPHSEFVCEITGDDGDVSRWLQAVQEPVWMPYLGRRGNAPSFPFVLGAWDGADDILAALPTEGDPEKSPDRLLTVHRVDGDYARHTQATEHVTAPVATRADQLDWAKENLTR